MQNVTELRKAGKLTEALELGLQELQNSPDDIWKKRNLAWVYYYLMKQLASEKSGYKKFCEYLREIFRLQLPIDEMVFQSLPYTLCSFLKTLSKSQPIDYKVVDWLLEKSKKLPIIKPSTQYSALLEGFHKAYKGNRQRYTEMVEWWGLDNLMPEDYEKTHYEDKEYNALAGEVYSCYAKHLLPTKNVYQEIIFDKEKAQSFLPTLEEIARKYPNYQYIPYHQAQLLLALGDRDNGFSTLLPFARKNEKLYWVWNLIRQFLSDDNQKVFACYCKGLMCKGEEDKIVKLREKIIPFFLEKQLYNEAKTEVDKIISVKQTCGHRIPNQVLAYKNLDWYKNANANKNNVHLYKKYAPIAEEILFSEFVQEDILIEEIREDKNTINALTEQGERIWFRYNKNLQIGETYKARFYQKSTEKPSKIATIIRSDNQIFKSQYIKDFSGNIVIRDGKNFGFVEKIYISPQICEKYNLINGNFIKGKAIKTFDKKKNKMSWKVFIVEE